MSKNKWVWGIGGMAASLYMMSAPEAMLEGGEKGRGDPGHMPPGRSAQKLGHSEVFIYVPQRRAAAEAAAALAGQRREPARESTSEKGPRRKTGEKRLPGWVSPRKRPAAAGPEDDEEDYLSPSPAPSPSPSAATDEDYLTPSPSEKESTASEEGSEDETPPRSNRTAPPPRKRGRTDASVTTSINSAPIAPPVGLAHQLLQLTPEQRTQLCHHLLTDQHHPMQLSVDQLRRQVQGLPPEDREALWSSFPEMTTPLGQFSEFLNAPENRGARSQLLRGAIESIHGWRGNQTTLSLRSRNYRKSEISRVGMALVYESLMTPVEQREHRWDWADFFGRHPFADVLGNQVTDSQTTITVTGAALVQVISQQCIKVWKNKVGKHVGRNLKSLNTFKLLGQSLRDDQVDIPAVFAETLTRQGWSADALEALAPGLSARRQGNPPAPAPARTAPPPPPPPSVRPVSEPPMRSNLQPQYAPPPPPPVYPATQPQYAVQRAGFSNTQPQYAPPPPPPYGYPHQPPYGMPLPPLARYPMVPPQHLAYATPSAQPYGSVPPDQIRYAAVPYPLTNDAVSPLTPTGSGGFRGWDNL